MHGQRTVRGVIQPGLLDISQVLLRVVYESCVLWQRHTILVVHLISLLLVAVVHFSWQSHAVALIAHLLHLRTRLLHQIGHLDVSVADIWTVLIQISKITTLVSLYVGHHDGVFILVVDVDNSAGAL